MKLKKKLAGVLLTAIAITSMPIMASDYDNHWAKAAIDKWVNRGIVGGFEDGTFRPSETITKAQFAKILVSIFGYGNPATPKQFTDVPSGKWYSDVVNRISDENVMYIPGTTFGPNEVMTREEAAYALKNAYNIPNAAQTTKTFTDSDKISSWAKEAVVAMTEAGLIAGMPDGSFSPKGSLTRAEVVVMLERLTGEIINKAGTYTKDVAGNVIVNTGNVILKDMNIKGNLYLTEGIGKGKVTLENVTVSGDTVVADGVNVIGGDDITITDPELPGGAAPGTTAPETTTPDAPGTTTTPNAPSTGGSTGTGGGRPTRPSSPVAPDYTIDFEEDTNIVEVTTTSGRDLNINLVAYNEIDDVLAATINFDNISGNATLITPFGEYTGRDGEFYVTAVELITGSQEGEIVAGNSAFVDAITNEDGSINTQRAIEAYRERYSEELVARLARLGITAEESAVSFDITVETNTNSIPSRVTISF